MTAVRALADLVHCPVTSASLQPPPFPLAESLQGDEATRDAQQTAALQSLEKASPPGLRMSLLQPFLHLLLHIFHTHLCNVKVHRLQSFGDNPYMAHPVVYCK